MVDQKLDGLDQYLHRLLADWNAPGVGVGVVVDGALVFAKGYGYRNYETKLPFTPTTLFQIASNTKLFTAVAAGLLVEEGKLTWDRPVRESVPGIRFWSDRLDSTVTLRDMLAHRTGISRHDRVWYRSDLSRRELFERLRYLEPSEAPRQTFLYNNLMYMAVGYLIELQSGKRWEQFVRERILAPLDMNATVYSVADMVSSEDHAVPFTEKRDSTEIREIPHYEDIEGIAPAGAIVSNISEVSHWLIALMNGGSYSGRQLLPASVLRATMEPAMAAPNVAGETRGFWELLNPVYGMGRWSASYRGHLLAYHGGALDGLYSQVSLMPQERIGAIVFVIGNHCAGLTDIVSYNVYERLLGMDETPWSERWLAIMRKAKKAGTEARAKAGGERIPGTRPSHALESYAGDYEHPAYGVMKIAIEDGELQFEFHKVRLPLAHFHYDRFDTPDDELHGKSSVSFLTSPQGDIDRAVMSLDEADVTLTRRPRLPESGILEEIAGTYETPDGTPFRILMKKDGSLYQAFTGQPEERLLPYRELRFRVERHRDVVIEFLREKGRVAALKIVVPSGEYLCARRRGS